MVCFVYLAAFWRLSLALTYYNNTFLSNVLPMPIMFRFRWRIKPPKVSV